MSHTGAVCMFRQAPQKIDIEALQQSSKFSRWYLRWRMKHWIEALLSIRFSLRTLLCFVLLIASAATLWWRWSPWARQHTLRGHSETVVAASFSPDGTRIATACSDFSVYIWDSGSGEKLLQLRGAHRFSGFPSLGFSSDGRRVIATGFDDKQAWDAISGEKLEVNADDEQHILKFTLKAGNEGIPTAFSPDGRRMVLLGFNRTAQVWEKRREDTTLGVLGLAELWLSVVFAVALGWSARRDWRKT